MKLRLSPVAFATSLALLSLSHTQAFAQSAEPVAPVDKASTSTQTSKKDAKKEANTLEQVVITSSKRAQPVYKIPYNVSVLTEEALRENNITDIKKLIAENEAINAPANSARFADNTTVRGLNTGNANGNNLEQFVRSTLSNYLDDTPLPNIGYRIKDIARVETLIGPQGTLYGAGALGGTVRYITNQPKYGVLEGALNTSVYQTKNGGLSNDTDGVFNVPLANGLALRASVSRLDEKGYTDRAVARPWQKVPAWTGTPNSSQTLYEKDDWQRVDGSRVALRWKAAGDLEFGVAHTQQTQVAHGTTGTQILPISKDPGAADPFSTREAINDHTIISPNEEFANRSFSMNSMDVDWNLGFAKLHSSTAKYEDRRQGQGDYTGAGQAFYGFWDATLDINDPTFNGKGAWVDFNNTYEGLVHETRLTSQGSGPWSWIGGIYYTKTQRSWKFSEMVPGLDAAGVPVKATERLANEGYRENIASDYSETAYFGELSYKPTDRWTLTGGARIFSYKDEGYSSIRDYTGPTSRETLASESNSGKAYFKVNAAYQFTDDLLSYATFSQGYRRGGVNGYRDYKTNTVSADVRAYQPDSTNNTELGIKGYAFDRALYLQAGIYQIDWKNPQVGFQQTIDDFFPINGIANGPDARSKGLELSARLRLNEQWQLTYNGATTSAEFTDSKTIKLYTNSDLDSASFDAGTALWGAPKWKHNLGVRYSTVLDNGWALSASLRGRYVDKIQWSSNGDRFYPAYALYSANVGLSKESWDVSLWANNLTDTKAVVSNNTGTGQRDDLGARMVYATPLTVGVNLSYYFR